VSHVLIVKMRTKKAQEMLPVLALLGLMIAFSIFFMYRMKEAEENSTNPFYGVLGEREMHLTALHQHAEADRFVLDTLARYASQDALSDYAQNYGYWLSSPCGETNGYPIVHAGDVFCERSGNMNDLTEPVKDSLNEKFYTRVVDNALAIPFNYEYQFIQDNDVFKVAGFAQDPIRYPLSADDFREITFSPETSSIEQPDYSQECTYLFANAQKAESIAGTTSGFTPRARNVKTGPCPENLNTKLVPYFNQCNIISCNQRSYCTVDEFMVCQEGCGLTALRMAYSYYGLQFDLSQTRPQSDLNGLFNALFASATTQLNDVQKVPTGDFDTLIETPESNREVYEGPYDSYLAAKMIGEAEYTELLELLEQGLVVARIRGKSPGAIMCEQYTQYGADDELGYCPKQHFFTIIAGNDDYVIINDPWTPNRDFRSGINVVLSKEFLQKIWSGRYILVKQNET
jgi:hypothetical protein